jgi:WD40 repeat protein
MIKPSLSAAGGVGVVGTEGFWADSTTLMALVFKPLFSIAQQTFAASTMEILNEMVQRCDKNVLMGVVGRLCKMIHKRYADDMAEKHPDELSSYDVKAIIQMLLLETQRQQDKDQNAFTVVLAARRAAGKPDFQMSETCGQRQRVSTGLFVVGGHVLSFISSFLSWKKMELQCEKMELQCEWKSPSDGSSSSGTCDGVSSCHISPCNSMILTSSGRDLHLWDAITGQILTTLTPCTGPILATQSVLSCRFFPDGTTIVSTANRTIFLWDVASCSLIRKLSGRTFSVKSIDVSPDSEQILSASEQTWKLWNSRTGELQHKHKLKISHLLHTACCSFSPNGRFFVLGGIDLRKFGTWSRLNQYDSTTYEKMFTFIGHTNYVTSCSFAPDSATMLTGSDDCKMKLWSTSTGQCLLTLDGLGGAVSPSKLSPNPRRARACCSFSPSGQEIISASNDGTLMLWVAATGQFQGLVKRVMTHHSIFALCVSSDGKYIVSGHENGIVKMWRVKWRASLK